MGWCACWSFWRLRCHRRRRAANSGQSVRAVDGRLRKRVDDYLKLRDEITKKVPEVKETGDPAKISAREQALGEAIAKARANAKPGDIFGADMAVHLRKTLAEDWKSRSPADRKALFSELPKGVQRPNQRAVSDDAAARDRARRSYSRCCRCFLKCSSTASSIATSCCAIATPTS